MNLPNLIAREDNLAPYFLDSSVLVLVFITISIVINGASTNCSD